ncbi:MAG: hypothetical protein JXJ22_16800 [Bacteroidales bacterium]|nr:hypothetical protein [Bacteroidales bacterium]
MEKNKRKFLELVLGLILLLPPVISVLYFIIQLIPRQLLPFLRNWDTFNAYKLTSWTGNIIGSGGGYTSALPLYIGLMAIAGALLIINSEKK